jgi:rSAM/selenodomain-associated transferase 2
MKGFRFSVFGFRCPEICQCSPDAPRRRASQRKLSHSPRPLVSIIIPTLNEAANLGVLLAGLPPAPDVEIILVDGGSADDTLKNAARFPHVQALAGLRGRGVQMNTGAAASRGELLVFLHADTRLGAAHLETLRRAALAPDFAAGAFAFRLLPEAPALRFIAWATNWRCRLFGLPYGDQALTVRRGLFFRLGGYAHRRPEDLDLVLRLKRHTRLRLLKPPVATSGRRWLTAGYFKTTMGNWLFLTRHLLERLFTRRWPEVGEMEKVGGDGVRSGPSYTPRLRP